MTDLSREPLSNWQVRKTKSQKQQFIEFMQERLPGLLIEEGGWLHCRNLVLGDPENADVIFTAHYDTCARLPFPNFVTPKNFLLYLLYQLLIMLPFFALMGVLTTVLVRLHVYGPAAFLISWILFLIAILYVFILGPANPHTVNDNTSGVLTLCELIAALDEEDRARCAFVFFDHEETGLFGSAFFASKHRQAMKNRLLINFDCVSDGDHILFVQSGRAKKMAGETLIQAFPSSSDKQSHIEGPLGAFYPSDQMQFRCGVGIAALKTAPLVGLYLSRIHTAKDTVCDERNFSYLVEGTQRFLQLYKPSSKK